MILAKIPKNAPWLTTLMWGAGNTFGNNTLLTRDISLFLTCHHRRRPCPSFRTEKRARLQPSLVAYLICQPSEERWWISAPGVTHKSRETHGGRPSRPGSSTWKRQEVVSKLPPWPTQLPPVCPGIGQDALTTGEGVNKSAFSRSRWLVPIPPGVLHAVNQNLETAGSHLRALPMPARRRLWGWLESGRGKVDLVRPGIQRHRPRAALGLQRLHHRELFRPVFMRNRDCAVAARAEGILSSGIKRIGVNSLSNGHRGDHFAAGAVDHFHQFVVAADEKPMMRQVNRHA